MSQAPDHGPQPTSPDQNPFSPEIDNGPTPEPMDEIQRALLEAAQAGLPVNIDLDELPPPPPLALPASTDLPAAPLEDEVQRALHEAAQQGLPTEIDFDTLPAPTVAPPVIAPPPPAAEPPPQPQPAAKPKRKPAPIDTAIAADFWLILALFVAFRGLALLLFRPGGYIRDWSDFDTFFGIAASADYGLYPFLDFWLEWPPLVPWLAVGAYKLALLLPPWGDDPRLWFILILGGVFLLFEVGNLILIHRLARRLFSTPIAVNRVLWLYALLFPPVYAMLGFFDGVALFFILLALDFLLAERRTLSAVTVGVGILVKVIPALVLPVALRRLWYQYRQNPKDAAIEAGLYLVTTALTVFILLIPFLMGGPRWLLASARAMAGRSSWETVWAVLENYYGFGVVLGNRLNPAETAFAAHDSLLPWGLITLIFTVIYLALFALPSDYSRPKNVLAFGGLTTIFMLIYNKGYSPQFLVYLLPFVILLMPTGRGVIYALILTALNVLEQPLFFVMLPTAHWLLTTIVTARLVILLLLGLEFGLILWRPIEQMKPGLLTKNYRYLPASLAGLAAIGLLALLPLMAMAYSRSQQTSTPAGNFVSFMATQPPGERLLLSNQETYRQVYPYLRHSFDLRLTDGPGKGLSNAPTPAQLLEGQSQVWILPTGPQEKQLRDAAGRGTEIAAYQFAGLGTASLYSFERNPLPRIAPARFIGGIELLAHDVSITQNLVDVTLFWRAGAPQTDSLTVFTQILDPDGQLIASHDGLPLDGTAPTNTWPVGEMQVDRHRIELPSNLKPGDYTLVAGLYNASHERVRGISPDGAGFANRAVPLEVLRFQ